MFWSATTSWTHSRRRVTLPRNLWSRLIPGMSKSCKTVRPRYNPGGCAPETRFSPKKCICQTVRKCRVSCTFSRRGRRRRRLSPNKHVLLEHVFVGNSVKNDRKGKQATVVCVTERNQVVTVCLPQIRRPKLVYCHFIVINRNNFTCSMDHFKDMHLQFYWYLVIPVFYQFFLCL